MLLLLALQVGLNLPDAPPAVDPEPAFLARAERLLVEGHLPQERPVALTPSTPAQAAAVAAFLRAPGRARVRLGAWLAGGTDDPLLIHACYQTALGETDEATALAALLAPASQPGPYLPALAHLALKPTAPLSLRAVALGRLLRAGSRAAWPIARSLLRTGTPLDEDAPWADWQRSGRYELPKRLLLIEMEAAFGATVPYEPNAALPQQAAQLRALDGWVTNRTWPTLPSAVPDARLLPLLATAAEDPRAARSLALLLPASRPFLERALASGNSGLSAAAERAFELVPRWP